MCVCPPDDHFGRPRLRPCVSLSVCLSLRAGRLWHTSHLVSKFCHFAAPALVRAVVEMSSSAPFSITAQALHDDIRHTRKLSLGCAMLDRVLGGGIDVQGITEVAGSAGAGKTQLVLRCLLHVQLPPSEGGLSGGAIYIFSEGSSQPSMRRPVLTRPRASAL